jgi:hypothetical protein
MVAPIEYIDDSTELFYDNLFTVKPLQIGFDNTGQAGGIDLTPERKSATVMKTGYFTPLIDDFFEHQVQAVYPDNAFNNVSIVLNPYAPYNNVSTEWLTRYAATPAGHRNKELYEQVERIHGVYVTWLIAYEGGTLYPGGHLAKGWEPLAIAATPYEFQAPHPHVGDEWEPEPPAAIPDPYDPDEHDYTTYDQEVGHVGDVLLATNAFMLALQQMNLDEPLARLNEFTTGTVELISLNPAHLAQDQVPKNIRRRASVKGLELRENLFSIGGLTQFRPSAIYDSIPEFPPLIQDFDLNLQSRSLQKYKGFSKSVSDQMVLELTPQTQYQLQLRSKNTFDQNNKSIQSCNLRIPKVLVFQKTFKVVENGEYVIPFLTSKGPPSKVFIHIERVSEPGKPYDKYPPIIKTVQLRVINQNVESVSTHDEYQINEITRRNSNVRTNVRQNRENVGGVLFGLDDLCNWVDFDVFNTQWDTFKGDFVVNELGISSNDERVVDILSAQERAVIQTQDRTIRVLFIYENYSLKGAAGNMRFWHTS